jgi:hypothetical protein
MVVFHDGPIVKRLLSANPLIVPNSNTWTRQSSVARDTSMWALSPSADIGRMR